MRQLTIIPTFGLVLLTACVTDPTEGELDQELIGGQTATTATYPTVVGLQNGNSNWFCTGVLIDRDWVLTAASCFQNTNTTQARFDDNNIGDNTGGRVVTIAEIHKHPNFDINSTTWSHDVALLRLAESITDRTPATIHRDAMTVGATVNQVGFGQTSNTGNGGQLHSLTSTSIDCARANNAGISNANLMCFDASDGTASCVGDGGAPAFANGEVVGLGSGGTDSSCTRGFDIYTSTGAEIAFIDTLIPHATTPPPTDPTTPPAPPPDDGSGGGTTRDPGDSSGKHKPTAVGCSAGGSGAGWAAMLGIALVVRRRRRR